MEIVEKPAEQVIVEQKQKTGRPVSLTEAYKYILARDGALKYAEKIAEAALGAPHARDRLSAAIEMEDRVSGKSVQVTKQEASLDDNTAKCLLELAERLSPKIAVMTTQPIVVEAGRGGEGIMLSAADVDNKGDK